MKIPVKERPQRQYVRQDYHGVNVDHATWLKLKALSEATHQPINAIVAMLVKEAEA